MLCTFVQPLSCDLSVEAEFLAQVLSGIVRSFLGGPMCSVYSAVSGEALAVVDGYECKTAKEVKHSLAAQVGVSRFRQRFWSEDWSHEMKDDEVFAAMKVHLIVLNLLPPEDEESQRMIAASMDDVAALEALLQGPRNPNVMDEDGHAMPCSFASCR